MGPLFEASQRNLCQLPVGLLIGRGGETKKVLQNTGATIHVAREDGGSEEPWRSKMGGRDFCWDAAGWSAEKVGGLPKTLVSQLVNYTIYIFIFVRGPNKTPSLFTLKYPLVVSFRPNMIKNTRQGHPFLENAEERTVTIKGTADAVAKAVKAVEEIIGSPSRER